MAEVLAEERQASFRYNQHETLPRHARDRTFRMDQSGPSLAIVFGCLCIAPMIALTCVILLVWLSQRTRRNLPADGIVTCPECGREYSREKDACPHCGRKSL
jgi:hypothetical protein